MEAEAFSSESSSDEEEKKPQNVAEYAVKIRLNLKFKFPLWKVKEKFSNIHSQIVRKPRF